MENRKLKQILENADDVMTISEIAKRWNMTEQSARYYIQTVYKLDRYGVKGDKRKVYYKKLDVALIENMTEKTKSTLSPFGNIELDFHENPKPLDPINNPNGLFYGVGSMIKACEKQKYWITDYGRVANYTTGIIENGTKVTHGYKQVKLNGMLFMVHRLVAYCFCENGKSKTQVHHINGIRDDNKAVNLIWCTYTEHHHADTLLRTAKRTNKKEDWQEYNTYIEQLEQDNKMTERMKLLVIKDRSGLDHYAYITKADYEKSLDENGKPDLNKIYSFREMTNEYQIKQILKSCNELYRGENNNE